MPKHSVQSDFFASMAEPQAFRALLSVRAFCLREGLKDGAFRRWQEPARRSGRR